jgi:hypothetical protein
VGCGTRARVAGKVRSPRTDKLIAASVQWAVRIMAKPMIDGGSKLGRPRLENPCGTIRREPLLILPAEFSLRFVNVYSFPNSSECDSEAACEDLEDLVPRPAANGDREAQLKLLRELRLLIGGSSPPHRSLTGLAC